MLTGDLDKPEHPHSQLCVFCYSAFTQVNESDVQVRIKEKNKPGFKSDLPPAPYCSSVK